MRFRLCAGILTFFLTLFLANGSSARTVFDKDNNGTDPEALIDRILTVREERRAKLADVAMHAEYVEGEERDGTLREKIRFDKRIYLKYLPDTVLYHEDYLAYYKDGVLQSDEQLRKEAADRLENKKQRNMRDISYPMLTPFLPEGRPLYDITYEGVPHESVDGYVCHRFRIRARQASDTLINGEYYFDAESFHLVRVDFSPAKLVKKLMFRLNELNMSLTYGPTGDDDIWLPTMFTLQGTGKAGLLFGVSFGGTEYYRNPVINSGIDEKIFEVDKNE
jgi:hypothetical protein